MMCDERETFTHGVKSPRAARAVSAACLRIWYRDSSPRRRFLKAGIGAVALGLNGIQPGGAPSAFASMRHPQSGSSVTENAQLHLRLRRQELAQDSRGHACWRVLNDELSLPASDVAIVICDMWDRHWSRGATERADAMAPRMNEVIERARRKRVHIIHAPSDTLEFYAGTPARERMIETPRVEPPASMEHVDPPLPIDDSDGGADTGEQPWFKAWSRQHPAIEIDQERDGISDDGAEIYSYLKRHGVRQLVIMGVHANMCVLGRSFGIKQMVRWGVNVALVRDLTDTMYNPAMRPYVNHDDGTRLVVEFIEKFWCPTISSQDLTAGN
jgi:nicotinamidase-related amidase